MHGAAGVAVVEHDVDGQRDPLSLEPGQHSASRGERGDVALSPLTEDEQVSTLELAAADSRLDEGAEARTQRHVILEHDHVRQSAPALHA